MLDTGTSVAMCLECDLSLERGHYYLILWRDEGNGFIASTTAILLQWHQNFRRQ